MIINYRANKMGMEDAQIIFVGVTEEAAIKSFFTLKGTDTKKVIGIYTARSKKNWELLKKMIKETQHSSQIDEREADFNDMNSVVRVIGWANSKYRGVQKTVNVTGLSKEGVFGLLLFYAFDEDAQRSSEIAMLQMNGKKIVFPPSMIFTLACETRKRGKRRRLGMIILKTLLGTKGEMPLKVLTKKLEKSKPTIIESLKVLECDKLTLREKKGREVMVKLNEFAYELMKMKENNKV